ncbi:MAG: phosphoglucosamine mutase [Pseudomonadota bacterium]
MARKWFGTDGIRGRVGELPIVPDLILKLGWAAGHVLAGHVKGRGRVLIGKDTRLSGYLLESALEAGLASAGLNVLLVGPLPTPAIAYLTRALRADAGIVISASHNPYADNGIKFFSGDGYKLPDAVEAEIEEWLERPLTLPAPDQLGKAKRVDDAVGRYVEFCKHTFPGHEDLNGLRIVVDCAHGATYKVAPMVLQELGATVIAMGNQPDGLNINDGVGSTDPALLQQKVVEEGAHLGIAFDGDGDRVVLVDERGQLVDGDQILYVIASAMQAQGTLQGGVVGTVMSNLGLERALAAQGIPFQRAAVGDRYVLEKMREARWSLGGETSGHIITPNNTTGDGIVAALKVLAVMRERGQPLSALVAAMPRLPQILKNVRLGQRLDYRGFPEVLAAIRSAEERLASRGRLLVRPSGTEALLRIMVEGEDDAMIDQVADEIATAVVTAMGKAAQGN